VNSSEIDPRIQADSAFVTNLSLCQVRLCNNAAFPWIMLVPNTDVIEIVDMQSSEQQILMQEICHASTVMRTLYKPFKLNIASIGNVAPQIHVHVVARYETDGAWPRPVWYSGVTAEYSPEHMAKEIEQLKAAFS